MYSIKQNKKFKYVAVPSNSALFHALRNGSLMMSKDDEVYTADDSAIGNMSVNMVPSTDPVEMVQYQRSLVGRIRGMVQNHIADVQREKAISQIKIEEE